MAAEDWRRLPQSKPENLLEALRSLTDPRDGRDRRHRLGAKLDELAERWERRATAEARGGRRRLRVSVRRSSRPSLPSGIGDRRGSRLRGSRLSRVDHGRPSWRAASDLFRPPTVHRMAAPWTATIGN